MTGIEIFILFGGCYALYTVGMAIATTVDYYSTEKEEKLILEELKNSGKPEEITKKISLGKISKFKEDNSLMTQDWVMEPKKKVKDIMTELKIPDLKIKEFTRIKIGD